MPELPEVETTVRGLAGLLEGEVIAHVQVNRPDLRRPFPVNLAEVLTGASVTRLGRRAKYGLIYLAPQPEPKPEPEPEPELEPATQRAPMIEPVLIFHLGMSGRWRIDPDAIGKHDHLVLETRAGHVLALNDARRFGSVDLVEAARLDSFAPFAAMGPEPLGQALTAAGLKRALAGRSAPIKMMLLDQRIVAGLGNIYVCEALHRARIRPDRPAGAVSLAKLRLLVPAIRDVLEASIAAGGSSMRDYALPDGELGYFAAQWQAYGREGEACACGGTVERFTQGGRSTFWCPRCQR